jgi:hypothetical protein
MPNGDAIIFCVSAKALVVDNNPDVLLLLKRRLGAVDYETIQAHYSSD